MADIVVIGAGVGGLAAGARLAARGHRVRIFEQAPTVGGKLGRLELDGFRFDTGPSLLTMPQVLEELFRATGASVEEHLCLRRLDPIARYRFGDGTWFDAPAGRSAMEDAVEQLRPGNGDQWRRFYARAEAIYDATHGPFLESPLRGWRSLVRQSARLRDLRTIAPWRSMRSLARQHLADERLVTFVDRYATYAGSDPRRAPAALASIPFVERHFGAWYVDGGLRAIADALLQRCAALGVEIQTDADVVGVVLDGDRVAGRVAGVTLADGSMVRADSVVANTDAAHLYGDLVPAPASAGVRRSLGRVQPSLSGFVICLAVDLPAPEVAHHTVLFPADYDAEFDDLFGSVVQPVRDPTIYLSAPRDPAVAPAGSAAWFVLVNAPRHDPSGRAGIDWEQPGLADRYADRIVDRMAERGIDVRRSVRWRALRTPADLARTTRSVGGSIYGTSSNGARAAFLRPRNRSPVPGLFLVGGSSHPGGGLPLVMLSARIVDDLIGPA